MGRSDKDVASDQEYLQSATSSNRLEFHEELNAPWSSLLANRGYKDELASLHLFCGAVAAFELLQESRRQCSVFLHGGFFALPIDFGDSGPLQLKPSRAPQGNTEDVMHESLQRRVVLSHNAACQSADLIDYHKVFVIPRSRSVVFQTDGKAYIGAVDIQHGEAESRFVAVTNEYISPAVSIPNTVSVVNEAQRGSQPFPSNPESNRNEECQTLILSDDTDVFMILLCNRSMHGRGVIHVLNDSFHDLDAAVIYLRSLGTCGSSLAALYCIGGCDFSPSIHGMGHEMLWRAFKLFLKLGGSLAPPLHDRVEAVHMLICVLYLVRHGKFVFCTDKGQQRRMSGELRRGVLSTSEIASLQREFFCIGKRGWYSRLVFGCEKFCGGRCRDY